jgi:NTE family protein
MKVSNIKNISFSSGAFKGWAYIGTIRALEESFNFNQLEQVLGASVGAIFGLFYLLQIKHTTLLNYFINMNIKELIDTDLDTMLSRESIIEGKKLKDFLIKIIEEKVNGDITFKELFDKTGIVFSTCAYSVKEKKLVYFNNKLSPDIKVIDAVMASAALPLLFPPYSINGSYYYDGGICDRYVSKLLNSETSIIFDLSFNFRETNFELLNLINGLCENLNEFYDNNVKNRFLVIDVKYKDEILNADQSKDLIFNLYMNGYNNTKKVLKSFTSS